MNIEEKIKEHVELASLTTYKIGGPARYFVEATNKEDIKQAIDWAQINSENFCILAGGSNMLVDDLGYDGLIIKMQDKSMSVKGERIECGSGAVFSQVVGISATNSLSGLEWGAGIPGTIGGAVRGNAGAYGGSISDVVETIEVYSVEKKRFKIMSRNDCQFEYRESLIKKNKDLIIVSVTLRLKQSDSSEINKKIENNIQARTKLLPNLPSAGCVFKNLFFDDIKKHNPNLADEIQEEGIEKGGKVSVGWLISKLDISGKKIGDTKISLEHANFIVNTGKATATDVVMMISYIKQQARDQYNIQLQEEIVYLGF